MMRIVKVEIVLVGYSYMTMSIKVSGKRIRFSNRVSNTPNNRYKDYSISFLSLSGIRGCL